MHLKTTLILLASFNAALTNAVAVTFPKGYTPSESEHAAAITRSEELASRDLADISLDLVERQSASGCVQAHCGAAKNTVPDFKTYYEYAIWHNGQLTHYLTASSSNRAGIGYIEWAGVGDPSGNQWGFRMEGDCGPFEYFNSIQSPSGWYRLEGLYNGQTQDEGFCYGESRSGQAKCVKATLWETTYADNGQYGGYAAPEACDYRGRCVDVNDVGQYGPQ